MTKHGIKRALSATMALTIGATATLLPLTAFATDLTDNGIKPTTSNYVITYNNGSNGDYIDMEFRGVKEVGSDLVMEVNAGDSPSLVISAGTWTGNTYANRLDTVSWHYGSKNTYAIGIDAENLWKSEIVGTACPGFTGTLSGFGSVAVQDGTYAAKGTNEILTTIELGTLTAPGEYTLRVYYKYQMRKKGTGWYNATTPYETNKDLLYKDITLRVIGTYKYFDAAGTLVSTKTGAGVAELGNPPANTADTANVTDGAENHAHYTYSWPADPDSNFEFHEAANKVTEKHNFVEAATPKATTEATIDTASTATYDYICSCGASYEQVETGSKVDTSALTSAINTVGGLTESAYTADSWTALTTAVAAGNTTLGTGSSTKADVDGATDAINNAINALVPYRSYSYSTDDGTNATFTTPDAGDITVDISAYRALEEAYNSIDMNKYVDTTDLKSAKATFDTALTKSYRYTSAEAKGKIEAELNSAISNLLFAITDANDESNLTKFSIAVTINGDHDTAGLVTYPASVKYNELNAFAYTGTGIVKEWQVTSNGTTSKATNIDGNSMQYSVTGTATDKNVIINLVVETPVDENQIQLQGKNNKVFDATYIAPGADIKATGNVLQIGDTTVITAPVASSGSTLKYWTLEDGTKIEVGGDAVALTGTGTIIATPHYFANPGYKMTVSGGKITDYNGLDHNSVYMTATNGTITGAYRQITTLTATDTSTFYAWAIKDGENYTIISYLPTYEFICEGSAEYKVITKAEATEYKPAVRLRTATANADGLDEPGSKFGVFTGLVNGVDQICVFGQLVTNSVDTKYTVQDCGVIADTTGAGNTGVKIGDTGAKQMPASNRMNSGQFTITVKKNLASYAGFTVRGYVTYSYTYNGTTITVTDYTNGVVVR